MKGQRKAIKGTINERNHVFLQRYVTLTLSRSWNSPIAEHTHTQALKLFTKRKLAFQFRLAKLRSYLLCKQHEA